MNKLLIFSSIVLMFLFLPILFLLYYGLGPEINQIGYSQEVVKSIVLTLLSSAFSSFIQLLFLTPVAYYLSRHRNTLLEVIASLPASVPHPIMGISLLLINSPLTPIGSFMHSLGIDFFNTFLGLIVALTVISSPIYLSSMLSFFLSVPREPEIYAMGMGASEMGTFLDVVLPNARKGIFESYLISMSRSMSEFGSVAIIAYSILQFPFSGTPPASVLIFRYYSFYGLGPSLTSSALLVLIGASFMFLLRIIERQD